MAEKEYIEREVAIEAAIDAADEWDGGYNPHRGAQIRDGINAIPAADVRPVVLCRDCIYWQKPQVWQNDGTFRDYELGEYERGSIIGGVSLEVGVNYGSFCALYNRNHENKIPQFMDENDFCSKGYRLAPTIIPEEEGE